MDIYFFCGSCGQHMVIDGAGTGLVIHCPKCGGNVTVPNDSETSPPSVHQPTTASRPEKEHTVELKWAPPAAPARKDRNG
ncbi:MAG TPA: hypothetical protein VMV72_05560 [Verrucomicrobiae bacterium]|nr:hypothetical protein [Verrucomicrobiae bacterium]